MWPQITLSFHPLPFADDPSNSWFHSSCKSLLPISLSSGGITPPASKFPSAGIASHCMTSESFNNRTITHARGCLCFTCRLWSRRRIPSLRLLSGPLLLATAIGQILQKTDSEICMRGLFYFLYNAFGNNTWEEAGWSVEVLNCSVVAAEASFQGWTGPSGWSQVDGGIWTFVWPSVEAAASRGAQVWALGSRHSCSSRDQLLTWRVTWRLLDSLLSSARISYHWY